VPDARFATTRRMILQPRGGCKIGGFRGISRVAFEACGGAEMM